MRPLLWLIIWLVPVFVFIGLHEMGWEPRIQQIGDYLVGKGLALFAGTIGMWFALTRLDKYTEGDWLATIADDPVSVRWVTCAVVLAVGVIVAWS